MLKIPKEYEDLLNWSKGRLDLDEFCKKWVPLLYNVQPEDKNYTSACVDLLVRVTERNDRTLYNWLSRRRKVPSDIKKMLFFVDLAWGLYYGLRSSKQEDELD